MKLSQDASRRRRYNPTELHLLLRFGIPNNAYVAGADAALWSINIHMGGSRRQHKPGVFRHPLPHVLGILPLLLTIGCGGGGNSGNNQPPPGSQPTPGSTITSVAPSCTP